MWLKVAGFVDLVRCWWHSYHFTGSPSFILGRKLKALKFDIQKWNMQALGNVGHLNKARSEELEALDSLEGVRRLAPKEMERKSLITSELEHSLLQEEISWRQKSRILWLKEGDHCTKFFHRVANSNRRSNYIESLSVNGLVSSNQVVIQNHVVQFYESLLLEQYYWRPTLDNLVFDSLDTEEASRLQLPFEEREVYEVVKGMRRDKAPCPDGFSIAFFQDCWEVIKDNIMGVFLNFHARGKFEKSLNAIFISLIPKKSRASDIKDYRPISLVGGVYKIIAKVLANRMRKIMAKIISKPQSVFVKGRQTLDSVLIANEC